MDTFATAEPAIRPHTFGGKLQIAQTESAVLKIDLILSTRLDVRALSPFIWEHFGEWVAM
ncbi:hypothetical protein N7539_009395 [Penicillium diatomitis]|uniref:Uncharacterized protein n=1 Tax=Penicillium diatomitis TaxID=2819901 RepID=A0A9W9WKK7_9EURO|nr:uncharacterized protein N7539_009395 [Penicillium diatomitis]KAJ5466666.1 hypothetical protein N7539_009395 [Penicillium diatomitis]